MQKDRISRMRDAHQVLRKFPFKVIELEKGYADRTLRIDLGNSEISIDPVDQRTKNLWTGGKGYDLWMMFQEIDKDTKWNSPENPICFSSGPLGGTVSFPGSGKTLVTSISPLTQSVMDCNVGGYFGPYLKFAGFDAMMVIGKAGGDVIIFIDAVHGNISIEKAPLESIDSHLLAEELTEMYADNELDHRNIACVTAGRGAEHARMGVLNFSFWDWRRGVARIKQAGRGGIGTVFRDKKIKAIVIKSRQITPSWKIEESKVASLAAPSRIHTQKDPADIERIRAVIKKWNSDPDYVIEMMQDIQDLYHYISWTAIDEIAAKTGKPKSHIYHIATFFTEFSLEPKGETIVQICVGTACAVKGASKVMESFERVLGIKDGQTTSDGKYTLNSVSCLGACSLAPVVKIGGDLFGGVQAKDVERILKEAGKYRPGGESGEKPKRKKKIRKLKPADLEAIASREAKSAGTFGKSLMVCGGVSCSAAKGSGLKEKFEKALKKRGLGRDYRTVATGCNGFCSHGPVVVVQPDGIFYGKVGERDIEAIIDGLESGKAVDRLLYRNPASGKTVKKMGGIGFFKKQRPIALRNRGKIDPGSIDQYIARGGYFALSGVLAKMTPEDVRREIIASGIRGRGGGGYPTGKKWESGFMAAKQREGEIFIVCNTVERMVIDTDPHSVIEGMLIGAYALGAKTGFIYMRKEHPSLLERMEKALGQSRDYGLLGEKILGSGLGFDIAIRRRTGAFIGGESSALIAALEGLPAEPRAKYIHSSERGFHGKPTVVNNAETWANIPAIMEKGARWYASTAGGGGKNTRSSSAGSKILTLAGSVNNTGTVEVPLGITLRELVEDIGGGVRKGRKLKCVQTGGPSGGVFPARRIDTPLDFDTLERGGSIMGSGAVLVMDDRTCVVDAARNFIRFMLDESCGKCTACREGLHLMDGILTRICGGGGREGDIEALEELCGAVSEASLCRHGGTAPNPVSSTIKHFRKEYEQHIRERRCAGGVCRALVTYRIDADACTGCTLCARACPAGAIAGEKKKSHSIDEGKCIKCGICHETCRFDAVEVI